MSRRREEIKWVIVAFDHPSKLKSVLYEQNLTLDELHDALEDAIVKYGANLVSIRGIGTDGRKD